MRRSDTGVTILRARLPRQAGAAGAAVFFFSRARRLAGATVLELVLVVALVGVLGSMVAPFLSNAVNTRSLDLFSAQASDALREAQLSVMNGVGGARYGVHFQADRFVLFQTAVYSAVDANNVVHLLNNGITVTGVTLSGGACTVSTGSGNCDVHFASHRGIPAENGTVVFTESGSGIAKTVTVGAAGMIDIN